MIIVKIVHEKISLANMMYIRANMIASILLLRCIREALP